jgi:hypothetical protein
MVVDILRGHITVSRRRARRLFLRAQVLLLCATLVLLTITVLQRPDHDGYQATHLFFVPRENWEMDFGRGMFHEKELYERMDAYQSVTADGAQFQGLTITHRSPQSAQGFNGILLAFTFMLPLFASRQLSILVEATTRPDVWQDDVPSPPPRVHHSTQAAII